MISLEHKQNPRLWIQDGEAAWQELDWRLTEGILTRTAILRVLERFGPADSGVSALSDAFNALGEWEEDHPGNVDTAVRRAAKVLGAKPELMGVP